MITINKETAIVLIFLAVFYYSLTRQSQDTDENKNEDNTSAKEEFDLVTDYIRLQKHNDELQATIEKIKQQLQTNPQP